MKYIKLTELKKEAKKQRKNNPQIKNQADSLNIIAKKNNQKSWTNLIDNSVLPLDCSEKDFSFSNKIISNLLLLLGQQMIVI